MTTNPRAQFTKLVEAMESLTLHTALMLCDHDLERYIILAMWDCPQTHFSLPGLHARVQRMLTWRDRFWAFVLRDVWTQERVQDGVGRLVVRGMVQVHEHPMWGWTYQLLLHQA